MLRYWPLVGCVVFGLLLMLGVNFAFARPDDFSASPNLVAFYESDRHAIEVALGSVAVVIAALLLLVLTTRLTARARDRGRPRRSATGTQSGHRDRGPARGGWRRLERDGPGTDCSTTRSPRKRPSCC